MAAHAGPAQHANRGADPANSTAATGPRSNALADTGRLLNTHAGATLQRAPLPPPDSPLQRAVKFLQDDNRTLTDPDKEMILKWLEQGGIQRTAALEERVQSMVSAPNTMVFKWLYGQQRFMEMMGELFPAASAARVRHAPVASGISSGTGRGISATPMLGPNNNNSSSSSSVVKSVNIGSGAGPGGALAKAPLIPINTIAAAYDGWLKIWAPNGAGDKAAQENLAAKSEKAAADLEARLRHVGVDPRPGNPHAKAANMARFGPQYGLWLSDMLTVLHDLRTFGPKKGEFRPVQTIETVAKWAAVLGRQ